MILQSKLPLETKVKMLELCSSVCMHKNLILVGEFYDLTYPQRIIKAHVSGLTQLTMIRFFRLLKTAETIILLLKWCPCHYIMNVLRVLFCEHSQTTINWRYGFLYTEYNLIKENLYSCLEPKNLRFLDLNLNQNTNYDTVDCGFILTLDTIKQTRLFQARIWVCVLFTCYPYKYIILTL
jgi:hypothetical protein